MEDKFGFLSIFDFGATIWYIFHPNVQCVVIHRCHLILFLNKKNISANVKPVY